MAITEAIKIHLLEKQNIFLFRFFAKSCSMKPAIWENKTLTSNKEMIYIKAGANASNISSNIENFACWMKCWMHLRGAKF